MMNDYVLEKLQYRCEVVAATTNSYIGGIQRDSFDSFE
jgi:hypothetical protein